MPAVVGTGAQGTDSEGVSLSDPRTCRLVMAEESRNHV